MDAHLEAVLGSAKTGAGLIMVLTGAGISAESGIPTFRGKEGYWVVGSRNYTPQEMATYQMFTRDPEEVWRWYLYRFSVCRAAEPNEGHRALVRLEHALQDRFRLVTQNIDGLHRRAGSSVERTYCIHGDFSWIRCARECRRVLVPTPEFVVHRRESSLSEDDREKITCRYCGGWMRPHVLWFDEYYDEEYYRMESALSAARQASLLLVVGTSGATTLPMQIGATSFHRGAAIVDINLDENPFAEMARRSPSGACVRGCAAAVLPEIVEALI